MLYEGRLSGKEETSGDCHLKKLFTIQITQFIIRRSRAVSISKVLENMHFLRRELTSSRIFRRN
jgi:hypothetical protein